MQLGIDAGNARVKVAGVQGVIDFDAALGEWRERNLVSQQGIIIQFQPEMVFFTGRCDGFFVVEHKGKRRKFFVEVDRATAPFNKAAIYNGLLQTNWESESWADPLKRGVISFPLVVVMTIRRHVVERDFAKAKFNYYILDLYNPKWEMIFR